MTVRLAGIDVGGTFLKSVVMESGGIVASDRRRVPDGDVLDFVATVGRELRDEAGVAAVGVGVAGLVTWPAGEFVWGPHVKGERMPIRDELARRLALPVVVDNDANMAALAEARTGAGRDRDPLLMLTFGTGIGGGMVIDGEVFRGRSFAGEFGHMTMVQDGPPCSCGGRGCWETLASGAALDDAARRIARADPAGRVARIAAGETPTGVHLTEAARAGDAAASGALETAGRWLGLGVVNLVVALDPTVVVVGGAMADAGEVLLGPARSQVAGALPGARYRPQVPIVAAAHGVLAGAVGAAIAAGRSMGAEHDA